MIVLTAAGTRGAPRWQEVPLRIHGRDVDIKVEVVTQSASGWLRPMPEAPAQVDVVHGDSQLERLSQTDQT
jgi:hypothetical protein